MNTQVRGKLIHVGIATGGMVAVSVEIPNDAPRSYELSCYEAEQLALELIRYADRSAKAYSRGCYEAATPRD